MHAGITYPELFRNDAPLDNDCSLRVYQSFTTIFHKCINIDIYAFCVLLIMLELRLMLLVTYYAQNYAGIIGGSLVTPSQTITYMQLALAYFFIYSEIYLLQVFVIAWAQQPVIYNKANLSIIITL